jgi:hypothetical protein
MLHCLNESDALSHPWEPLEDPPSRIHQESSIEDPFLPRGSL